jgi:RHS repeat-associated protein
VRLTEPATAAAPEKQTGCGTNHSRRKSRPRSGGSAERRKLRRGENGGGLPTRRYGWDGNTNGLELAFVRGLDLSGTLQGAGGVGGLLFVGHFASAIGYHAVACDGNGNVAALVDAADGTESARYEYGPFGEPLRVTGPMGKVNPLRFSTQYADDWTGDLKYLYRDYRPDLGRWPSRDPLEEFGGINIYAISQNDFVNHYDRFGLLGPLAGFAVECIKEIAGGLAHDWLKNQGDKNAACGLVFDHVRGNLFNTHMGCGGELVIPSSPFMNNEERKGWGGRIAGCLWSKIKSKGIGKILKDLPEGVEQELLEEALGGGIDKLEDATNITDATHQIRATCGNKGINVSVFTQVTLTLGEKTFNLRTDEKKLGQCVGMDASSLYDSACRCCAKSPFHPDHPKEQ